MKIFVAGTFDNFHIGHQYLLWNAYHKCQRLVVVVARDETVRKIKRKLPRNNEQVRLGRLLLEFNGIETVNIVFGRRDANFMKTLERSEVSHLYLGYDQKINMDIIFKNLPHIKVERQKPYFPEFFKSSKF